jgi:hypothetical protein
LTANFLESRSFAKPNSAAANSLESGLPLSGVITLAFGQPVTSTGRVVEASFTFAAFTLILESPILEDMYFEPGLQLSCNQCGSVSFFADAVALWLTSTPSQVVSYQIAGAIGYNFFFPPAAFETPGTYESIVLVGIHDGVLEVRGLESEPAPEPATFPLLAAGLGLIIGAARRNR